VSLEWFETNKHIDYPFESKQTDLLKSVFVDAMIVDGEKSPEQIVLKQLTITDLNTATITVQYEPSASDFFSSYSTRITQVDQWIVARFYNTAQNKSITLVLDTAVPYDSGVISAAFLTKCINAPISTVTSFTVGSDVVSAGEAIFKGGYNVVLQQNDVVAVGSRSETPISIAAIPGAGLGFAPSSCDGDGILRTINGVGPSDTGNVDLICTSCLRAYRPVISAGSGQAWFDGGSNRITLANDCKACCTCDQYGNTYSGLTKLYNTGRDIGKSIVGTGNKVDDNKNKLRDRYNASKTKLYNLRLIPYSNYIFGVQVICVNNTDYPVQLSGEGLNLLFSSTTHPQLLASAYSRVIGGTIKHYNDQYADWAVVPPEGISTLCADTAPTPSIRLMPQYVDNLDGKTRRFGVLAPASFGSYYFEVQFMKLKTLLEAHPKVHIKCRLTGSNWYAYGPAPRPTYVEREIDLVMGIRDDGVAYATG